MKVVVVGAGAVGRVLGTSLERAGHDVAYWARAQALSDARFEVVRAGQEPVISGPVRWLGPDPTPIDYVIVCVRTEQLTAALAQVAGRLGREQALLISTITFEGARQAARAAGFTGPALAFHTSFGAYFEGARVCWFPFSVPSVVSAEGDALQLGAARTLATIFSRAGIPSLALRSMASVMRAFAIATTVLLPSWAACDWELSRLSAQPKLRAQTTSAMHEAVRAFAPPRTLLRVIPKVFFALVLRALPLVMSERARTLWRAHGPKIEAQTRFSLEQLLASEHALPHVRALYLSLPPGGTRDRR